MSETKSFYSNGKILLTGEYLVLKGAEALAFPSKFGQKLEVYPIVNDNKIVWQAYDKNKLWFTALFDLISFNIEETSDTKSAQYLKKLFEYIDKNSSIFSEFKSGIKILTQTNFPRNWGLGTSSTLINNLASWANINPYELLTSVSKGSGYDIACALSESPILFQRKKGNKPIVQSIEFKKDFLNKLYFVYSGNKKETEDAVLKFLNSEKSFNTEINTLNHITRQIIETDNFYEFCELIVLHENILCETIKEPGLNSKFQNFEGVVKWLGAWGGDFFLAASNSEKQYLEDYFETQNTGEIIPFKELLI